MCHHPNSGSLLLPYTTHLAPKSPSDWSLFCTSSSLFCLRSPVCLQHIQLPILPLHIQLPSLPSAHLVPLRSIWLHILSLHAYLFSTHCAWQATCFHPGTPFCLVPSLPVLPIACDRFLYLAAPILERHLTYQSSPIYNTGLGNFYHLAQIAPVSSMTSFGQLHLLAFCLIG